MSTFLFQKVSFLAFFIACPSAAINIDYKNTPYLNNPDKWAESAYNRIFIYSAETCVKMTFRRVGIEWDESVLNKADPKELPVFYTQVLTGWLSI